MSEFKFLNYVTGGDGKAEFNYEGADGTIFSEKVKFFNPASTYSHEAYHAAMDFALVVLGTSYYKAHPTTSVKVPFVFDSWQAEFFDKIYQEGMSQYAFENNLTRADLAHFKTEFDVVSDLSPEITKKQRAPLKPSDKVLVLVSGGKDSLLTAEKIRESGVEYRVCYITAQQDYPEIINEFVDYGEPVIIRRMIDKENLKKAGGKNGHVPVTLINEALALVQAILLGYNRVELGVGREGLEPHAHIGDLPVNHQWSKTVEAQDLLKDYVTRYIDGDIRIGSQLEDMNELEIAKEFTKKCWTKYGDKFSSCNVANYKQDANNSGLKWCGKCAKCANSYLLFAPFVPFEEQMKIFGRDLFEDPEMTEIFKGLLGVDGVMKPFECVASIDELRWAYQHRLPGYGELPFEVG